jgi:cellulose synthase operon protein YhjQ
MTERSSDPDQSPTAEDIATLYSRANVQGTKYWDFSASRKEARGQFRHRLVQEQAERAGAEQQAALAQRQVEDPQLDAQPRSGQVRPEEAGPPGGMRALTGGRAAAPQAPADATSWAVPEPRGKETGPALWTEWPAPGHPAAGYSPAAGSETLPQPREGMASASRWYALQSVFTPAEKATEVPESLPAALGQRPPMVAVFSLAGGVGKTCLVATLGRALSALGERVLLADTAAYGLLPFYFGSREFKPGVVRTFSPPGSPHGSESDAPVHVLSLDAERYPGDGGEHDPLLGELVRDGRGANRILVDVATASRDVTSRLLLLRPTVLVPLLPDMSSVARLGSLEAFLAGMSSPDAKMIEPLYLLNQFDASLPLHLDMREMLQHQLGARLLPFVLRRSSAMSEALAEGMTVIDYAPDSPAAEDYWHLAGWLRSVPAPAAADYGGVRWSER